jgi:8-oxo-dGTP pyrophosphatase MutT (NUDIX family)
MNHTSNINKLREISREIVSALIFSSDNKVLMGKKDPLKGGVYSDCWHLPGGGIENGEDKIQGLIREISEEVNLDIKDNKIELIDEKGSASTVKILKDTGEKVWCNMNFFVYKIQLENIADDVHLIPSDDLVELEWINLEDIFKIKLTPPSEDLLRRLNILS